MIWRWQQLRSSLSFAQPTSPMSIFMIWRAFGLSEMSVSIFVARECLKNRCSVPKHQAKKFKFPSTDRPPTEFRVSPTTAGAHRIPALGYGISRLLRDRLMARLEYFIVCESTSVDVENNRISFFHVLEDIYPDQFPYLIPRLDAVSLWNLSPDDQGTDFQAMVAIRLPGIERVVEIPMNLSRGYMRHRAAVTITGIPISRPGELVFEVKLNGAHGATHIVYIHDTPALDAGERLTKNSPISSLD